MLPMKKTATMNVTAAMIIIAGLDLVWSTIFFLLSSLSGYDSSSNTLSSLATRSDE
jgi:hypothetical protein